MAFEPNIEEKEGNYWVISGFVAMIIGLMYFIIKPEGVIIGAIGALAFGIGWHRWSPVGFITNRGN